MKKSIFFKLIIALLLSGCSSLFPNFESSSGNIGEGVDDALLINAFVNQVTIQSRNVTAVTPLQGVVNIENSLDRVISGKILFEITMLDSFQPVWVANITVEDISPGRGKKVPFTFYSEDIVDSINFEEVDAEKDLSGSSGTPNRYDFDLIVRSQTNESRVSFVYYRRK